MKVTYIKELRDNKEILGKRMLKCPNMMQKIDIGMKRKFGICNTVKIGKDEKLKVLPYTIEELIQKQTWYRKQLERESNIILSKDILLNKSLKVEKHSYKVWNGKILFQYLMIQTLEYISGKIGIELEKMNVAIIISDITNEKIKLIEQLARKVKCVSIITKKIAKFRRIEEKLYIEKGIAIKISNNKRKSLKKEKIIINMDLNQQELEEYEINKKAIIINVTETIYNISKGFHGININQLEITSKRNMNFKKEFLNSHYYESKMFENIKTEEVEDMLEKDGVQILYLIGQRGKIQDAEYKEQIVAF